MLIIDYDDKSFIVFYKDTKIKVACEIDNGKWKNTPSYNLRKQKYY